MSEIFASNLKKFRFTTGLTQADVADKIEVKTCTYQAYEENRSEPPIAVLVKLLYLFKINDWRLMLTNPSDLRIPFGDKFVKWFTVYSMNGYDKERLLGELYTEFLIAADYQPKEYSVKKFIKGLRTGAWDLGFDFLHRKERTNGNKVIVKMIKRL